MNDCTVLMYHQVGRFPTPRAHRSLYCDAGAFRRQMRYLRASRTPVVSLEQVLAACSGGRPLPPRAVLLTFDDGYRNVLEHAVATLSAIHLPAVLFVVSGLLGGVGEWMAADGLPVEPLASAEELRWAMVQGMAIGAHSRTHAHLPGLADGPLRDEVSGSRQDLEATMESPIPAFCYPYGDFDARVAQATRDAGYQVAFTCQRDRLMPGRTDPLRIPRVAVSYGTSLPGFLWKLYFQKAGKTGG